MQCSNCNTLFESKKNFCEVCGTRIVPIKTIKYDKEINETSWFFIIFTIFITATHIIEFEDYKYVILTDLTFIVLVSIYCFIEFNAIKKMLHFRNIKPLLLIYILIGAIVSAFCITFIANKMNQSLFEGSQSTYYETFILSPAPLLFAILSIGVVPAIFEELAFRGVLFHKLLKLTSLKSVIITTSILFSILHFSLISMLWLLPLGLVFGYLRARYRNLIYGMFAHFIYNSSIVIIQYYDLL
jgi:uncharacterized protein